MFGQGVNQKAPWNGASPGTWSRPSVKKQAAPRGTPGTAVHTVCQVTPGDRQLVHQMARMDTSWGGSEKVVLCYLHSRGGFFQRDSVCHVDKPRLQKGRNSTRDFTCHINDPPCMFLFLSTCCFSFTSFLKYFQANSSWHVIIGYISPAAVGYTWGQQF